MTTPYTFPRFKEIFATSSYYGFKHLKFRIRCLAALPQIKQFENFINASPCWRTFFQKFAAVSYPLIHTYLDKRFIFASDRLEALITDLTRAEKLFGSSVIEKFNQEQPYVLAQITDHLTLQLNRNDLCSNEGFWAVSLRDESGKRLYTSTFAFTKDNGLLITSVQGPAGEDAKDIVRSLTKTMHGLRPQQFMIIVLQLLAARFGINSLLGISQEHHVKIRWKLKKRVLINYNEFWQSVQGQQLSNGYWSLPQSFPRKSEAEIESKKRSMYRKRHQMLDDIENSINQKFV